MTFKVGQKVVCVDISKGFTNLLGEHFDCPDLTLGGIYTLSWVGLNEDGAPSVSLVEIPARRAPKGKRAHNDGYPFFGAGRFRPIVDKKTDISFAHEILDRVSRKQSERA